ncbi:hypothetical protein N0V93_003777 [Gnomoniopsis smithogilvyi]|uniref:Uncharacterized protein n=1 Tax=Gnomoniopsis smithogilvyi TaxID=1191159 RepID=A0A9W9D0C7_9PEZI|nr:hypothetical protein N0V93_003777 [Gnomoniopsis smithogilvyi]
MQRTRSSIYAPACPPKTGIHPGRWLPLETPRRRDAGPLPPVERRFGRLAAATVAANGAITSNPGAKVVKPAENIADARYSLMQVPEDPGFYVPTPPKGRNEYAHIGSLDGSDADYIKLPATQSKRYGSYIVRAPPSSRARKKITKTATRS